MTTPTNVTEYTWFSPEENRMYRLQVMPARGKSVRVRLNNGNWYAIDVSTLVKLVTEYANARYSEVISLFNSFEITMKLYT